MCNFDTGSDDSIINVYNLHYREHPNSNFRMRFPILSALVILVVQTDCSGMSCSLWLRKC